MNSLKTFLVVNYACTRSRVCVYIFLIKRLLYIYIYVKKVINLRLKKRKKPKTKKKKTRKTLFVFSMYIYQITTLGITEKYVHQTIVIEYQERILYSNF